MRKPYRTTARNSRAICSSAVMVKNVPRLLSSLLFVLICICMCVDSVDANWGPWSIWTSCSSSCDKFGIRHRFRPCNSPDPHVDSACQGLKFGTEICHPPPCCTDPPRIHFISPDTYVHPGDHVILHCNATGADSIIWEGSKIVGHTYPKNVEMIPEVNDLLISDMTSENTGLYHCVAANACGSTFRTVTVKTI